MTDIADRRGDPMLKESVQTARVAGRCICNKRMLQKENEGTCLWCGHGRAVRVIEHAYQLNAERNSAPRSGKVVHMPRLRGARHHRVGWTEEMCIEAARQWEIDHGRLPTRTDWQYTGGMAHPTYVVVYKLFGGWPAFMQAIAEVPREQVAA